MTVAEVQNPNWIDTDLIHMMLAIVYDDQNWKEDRLENTYRLFVDNGMHVNFIGTLLKYIQNYKHFCTEKEYNDLYNYILALAPKPHHFMELVVSSAHKETFKKITKQFSDRFHARSRVEVLTYPISKPPDNNRQVLVVDRANKGIAHCYYFDVTVWRNAYDNSVVAPHRDAYWFDIPF